MIGSVLHSPVELSGLSVTGFSPPGHISIPMIRLLAPRLVLVHCMRSAEVIPGATRIRFHSQEAGHEGIAEILAWVCDCSGDSRAFGNLRHCSLRPRANARWTAAGATHCRGRGSQLLQRKSKTTSSVPERKCR